MSKVELGSGVLQLEDVLAVAARFNPVACEQKAVDLANAALIPSTIDQGGEFVAETIVHETRMELVEIRATMLLVAADILRGSTGVRAEVAADLVALLNARIAPVLPASASVADIHAGMASAVNRRGDAVVVAEDGTESTLAMAVAASDITPPAKPVTAMEAEALTRSRAAALAPAALAVATARSIGPVLDAATGLSVEALSAVTASFSSEAASARPRPGAVSSAARLRALTAASGFADASLRVGKGRGAAQEPADVRCAPHVNGAVADAADAARRAVRAEVNSSPLLAWSESAKAPGAFDASSSAPATAALLAAMPAAATAAAGRCSLLTARAAELAGDKAVAALVARAHEAAASAREAAEAAARAVASCAPDRDAAAGDAALLAARSLVEAVAAEVVLASTALLRRRAETADAAAAAMARAAAAGEARAAKEAAAAAKEEAEHEAVVAAMEEAGDAAGAEAERAKRAKILQKRAKKAAKSKKGKKQGAEGAGGGAGVSGAPAVGSIKGFSLGQGSAAVLRAVEAALLPSVQASADPVAWTAAAAAALADSGAAQARAAALLSPLTSRGGALTASLAEIVERLSDGGATVKVAKGARDFMPEQMDVRRQVMGSIRDVFRRHGAVEIDTPVFEERSTLTGKYGEDSKLIYDLADQGGELLSLRYDLTVPFARFLATHGLSSIKRYHIAKVYRRDQPAVTRGRFREFYQCDFDVAGEFERMVPDAEVLAVGCEILASLPIGDFRIKLNHRVLLDAMLDICGVPASKFRPICSAIDKLDKEPWSAVREEMVGTKGLDPAAADRIEPFVALRGEPLALLARLTEGEEAGRWFGSHPRAATALEDLRLLFGYLDAMGRLGHISFDLSLARGLDYYTGVIYEAVLVDGDVPVGSIAAGGRYDNLVGMFSHGAQVPCVGISIGIERVFAILEARARAADALRVTPVDVLVASIGSGLLQERMRVAGSLWAAGVSAEFSYAASAKLTKQLAAAEAKAIPFVVLFGATEMEQGLVKIRVMADRSEHEVSRDALLEKLAELGCPTGNAPAQ